MSQSNLVTAIKLLLKISNECKCDLQKEEIKKFLSQPSLQNLEGLDGLDGLEKSKELVSNLESPATAVSNLESSTSPVSNLGSHVASENLVDVIESTLSNSISESSSNPTGPLNSATVTQKGGTKKYYIKYF